MNYYFFLDISYLNLKFLISQLEAKRKLKGLEGFFILFLFFGEGAGQFI